MYSNVSFTCFPVKLNGGRHVTGVLRGFDPFMNLVLDEAVEEVSAQEKHNIGMVVSILNDKNGILPIVPFQTRFLHCTCIVFLGD